VPVGGAAAGTARALGNALVGNEPDAAALEICLSGPTLVADVDLACAVFGAPFEVTTSRRRVAAGRTFTLRAGEELTVAGTPSGMRAYVCVRGGLSGPVVLGSQSSLAPIANGAEVGCVAGRIRRRFLSPFAPERREALHYLPGAQADWFPDDSLEARTLTVTTASNRMGLRLQGEPLPVSGREMVSEPVCPGTVQVTRDGQCIVLGVDGQTIGGYPKIAQVISADLDALGQLRPGETVVFRRVGREDAERRYREKQALLAEWTFRMRLTADD
jgi:antagonist of KipI